MVQCEECKNWEHSICRGFFRISDDEDYHHVCYKCTDMNPIPDIKVSQEVLGLLWTSQDVLLGES